LNLVDISRTKSNKYFHLSIFKKKRNKKAKDEDKFSKTLFKKQQSYLDTTTQTVWLYVLPLRRRVYVVLCHQWIYEQFV
jgi:hypothetical protein